MSEEPKQSKLRLKDKRQRLMWIKVASGASVVAIAFALLWYVARLPGITIGTVDISGVVSVEKTALEDIARSKLAGSYFFFIPRMNALVIPKSDIVAAVAQAFPTVENVSVTREGWQSLSISVSEREPAAFWCANDACYLMDKNGFVFAEASKTNAQFMRFSGLLPEAPITATFLEGEFAPFKLLIEEISSTVRRTPEAVLVEESGDVTISFMQGGELKFVRSTDRATLIDNIASVFSSRSISSKETLEYADFRFGDKVYVKFREE